MGGGVVRRGRGGREAFGGRLGAASVDFTWWLGAPLSSANSTNTSAPSSYPPIPRPTHPHTLHHMHTPQAPTAPARTGCHSRAPSAPIVIPLPPRRAPSPFPPRPHSPIPHLHHTHTLRAPTAQNGRAATCVCFVNPYCDTPSSLFSPKGLPPPSSPTPPIPHLRRMRIPRAPTTPAPTGFLSRLPRPLRL